MSLRRNIKVPFTKLRSILHLGDLHVRLVKRHSEYKECFSTLFTDLQKENLDNTLIYIAGDVVHAKTDLSPEMVDVASDFLRNMAELAPTIVIAGNHDLNLANPNRLDALSPIIQNINHPNLHYLRESGIYKIADVEFGVMSIIGDQADWPSADELKSDTKIALFHGPINNAQTDVGFTITNRHMPISIFDGYHIAGCGDIHRMQTLQQYDATNGKPIVTYCGSLIMQNHGESLKNHGWLKWDVASRSFEFNELYNEYGYYTLTIGEDKKIPDFSDMPDTVRLRMFVPTSMDISDIARVKSILRKKRNIQEIIINRSQLNTGAGSAPKTTALANIDIHSVTYQNELITDYIERHLPNIDAEMVQKVTDINAKLNSKLVDEEFSKNIRWRPKMLKFSNMFCYGEDNYVNFEHLSGTYGLFSPNASGKCVDENTMIEVEFDEAEIIKKVGKLPDELK